MWRTLEHTADLCVEVEAASWAELVREAARCFGELVGGQPCDPADRVHAAPVELTGGDAVAQWVGWWRALLRLWTVDALLAVDAEVALENSDGPRAQAQAVPAERLDDARCLDLKAVTWHDARIEQRADGHWRGRIVLDV